MPSVESFAIRRRNSERRHLALREAELLGVMDIVPEKRIDLVGIESAEIRMSLCAILICFKKSITIVARVALAADQGRWHKGRRPPHMQWQSC
jgi:hypothetical protein